MAEPTFALARPIEPMLAKSVDVIPQGDGWLYEPKWDGFRAIIYRSGCTSRAAI